MKTKAVRLYGKNDLRLEEFDLPEMKEDEIFAKIITDSVCMSTLKLLQQGESHKKAPKNLKDNPIIIGHEFCGVIEEVGSKWKGKYAKGQKFTVQANLLLPEKPYSCPGYTYPAMGGDATYIILSDDVMRADCLILYEGDTYFEGSLMEPLSCVIAALDSQYHVNLKTHQHDMGIKEGGNLLIMAGTGPMGLLAIDYALHGDKKPKRIVVTDRHQDKLDRAKMLYPSQNGIQVEYLNIKTTEDEVSALLQLTNNEKYDDIIVMAANSETILHASMLAADDACINFFAGPKDKDFMASVNFYDIHYAQVHYIGMSGGNADDMRKAANLVKDRKINVANIVTHVLGLNDAAFATENQKTIGGAKKLIYTHKKMDIAAIKDVPEDTALGRILKKNNYVWNKEAEDYILSNQPEIS